jgi:crotonobetainyl-CoA:carnitine CoA-transferase CaiB-like acyl-CoA transferase
MDLQSGALSGITILDLSRILAGPFATMLLGDLGADVIKVERPGAGDDTRQWGPPFTPSGESAYYLCANRNKKSITVDLSQAPGRALVRELATRADVLVENFRAGAMDRWEIGYSALSALNPGLVYCTITGYGQTGPYRDRPGYDNVIEAQGGVMSITGPSGPDGEPCKVGVAIVDITAGLYAALSILAALRHRDASGHGQYIDVALFDVQLSWLANVASAYLVSGEPPQRYGNAHPSIVPYQTVRTNDGHLMLAVGNDTQFRRLCEIVGCTEWASDSRFSTNAARVEHRDELMAQLEREFEGRSSADWTSALQAAGIPCGPVNSIPQALDTEQAQARGMLQSIPHPADGDIRQIGPAVKLSKTPASIRSAPPRLGEHTEEVLRDFLGRSDHEVHELRSNNVI